jgi:hypothetical protein
MLLFVTLHLLLLQGEQSPSNAAEWKRLGLALASEKKLVAAVGPLAKACELDPKEEEACYYFARTLHALGRWDARPVRAGASGCAATDAGPSTSSGGAEFHGAWAYG